VKGSHSVTEKQKIHDDAGIRDSLDTNNAVDDVTTNIKTLSYAKAASNWSNVSLNDEDTF
jgi:hypothetical protein